MNPIPPVPSAASHSDPAAAAPAEPGFEVKVHAWWTKYRTVLLGLAVLVLVGIVAREGWQYFAAAREQSLQQEFASLAGKPDKLAAFADANAGHPLAGVAYLQVADREFEAANYPQAAATYAKATAGLKNVALLARAKLGAAVSKLSSGDVAGGESALRALANEESAPKQARAEASYHLAALAVEAGKADEVRKLAADIMKVDGDGPWAQRAMMLLSTVEAPAPSVLPALPPAK